MRSEAEWAGAGEYVIGFAPIQAPTRLTALVGLPLSGPLRESEALFWKEMSWTLAVFLLAALIAIIGAHYWVGRPIRALNASVDSLARGDFDSNILSVSVADDGLPLAQDFDRGKNGGLGMKMVGALLKQLRAKLDVIRSASGKTFVVHIPLEE